MAENRRGKDKRFYFSRGQLVLLGGGFIVATIVIFFLGMLVGKEIEVRKAVMKEEPLVKIPVKPSGPGGGGTQGGQGKNEMTFYETLTKSPTEKPSSEEKPGQTKSGEISAKADIKPIKPAAKIESSLPTAMEKPAAKVERSTASSPKTKETEASGKNGETKGWTIQVNAYPDERSAKLLVDRLKNKGYNAYATDVRIRGKVWYRVRVGSYASREEAEKVEETLKSKENYTRAFATSR